MKTPLCIFGPGGDFVRPWPEDDDRCDHRIEHDETTTRDPADDDGRPSPAPPARRRRRCRRAAE
jgi:hypothetical protein